jgi:cell division protein FtsA
LEIFRLARAQIVEKIPRDVLLAEIVLTGGGAHLRGIEQAASDFFGIPARVGVPTAIGGLTDTVKQPQYATAVGLVLFGPKGDGATWFRNGHSRGVFTKIASWFGDLWD